MMVMMIIKLLYYYYYHHHYYYYYYHYYYYFPRSGKTEEQGLQLNFHFPDAAEAPWTSTTRRNSRECDFEIPGKQVNLIFFFGNYILFR